MRDPTAPVPLTPDGYLHSLARDDAVMVPMNRQAYRESIFLDHRIVQADGAAWSVPISEVALRAPARQPVNWIFHIAHCGSTLLARALDELEAGLVLREPLALRQVALEPAFGALLGPVMALLSRRYDPGVPTVIKANVPVNFILEDLVPAQDSDRSILLFGSLEDYLCAVLRTPHHRAWVRSIAGLLAEHLGEALPGDDAAIAALLWWAQLDRFAALLQRSSKAVTLDFEQFLNDPAAGLAAACKFIDRPVAPAAITALVQGPLFAAYAKNPALRFDNSARMAARAAAQQRLAPEIAAAQAWLQSAGRDSSAMLARMQARSLI